MSSLSQQRQPDFSPYFQAPAVQFYPEFDPTQEEFSHIKAMTYTGAPLQGVPTKVFAHLGFPQNAGDKVPAVVLVHGGGGHPDDRWIRYWNEQGFAALAMSTTGNFPTKPLPRMHESFHEGVGRFWQAPFQEEGFCPAPDNSAMKDNDLPLEDQWLYHAVSQVILAHSLLAADPRVDAGSIGLCGISWGAVISSIVLGYDPRIAWAVPIYGAAHLKKGLSDLSQAIPQEAEVWFAEKRLDRVTCPVLWLAWNADTCFSVHSNVLSYLSTCQQNPNTRLCLLHEMMHSHAAGYTPRESYAFGRRVADGLPQPRVWAQVEEGRLSYGADVPLKAVRLFSVDSPITYTRQTKHELTAGWMQGDWQITDLDPAQTQAPLPPKTYTGYVEFTLPDDTRLCAWPFSI